jgi:uncharacterized protein YjiS (DUF1127 family)
MFDGPFQEFMDASASGVRRPRPWHARIAVRLRLWQGRARQRRALARLDTRLLADIGVSEAEARRECAKPFWR